MLWLFVWWTFLFAPGSIFNVIVSFTVLFKYLPFLLLIFGSEMMSLIVRGICLNISAILALSHLSGKSSVKYCKLNNRTESLWGMCRIDRQILCWGCSLIALNPFWMRSVQTDNQNMFNSVRISSLLRAGPINV